MDRCHVLFNDLLHVVILVFEGQDDALATQLLVHLISNSLHSSFAIFKSLYLKVADNVAGLGFFDSPAQVHQVVEALVALSFLWSVGFWQLVVEVNSQLKSIDHLVLSSSWMDIAALEGQFGSSSAKGLVLEFS